MSQRNKYLIIMSIFITIFYIGYNQVWLKNKRMEIKKEQWHQSTEPYEVRIPYYDGRTELVLNFPRCNYSYLMESHYADYMWLEYPKHSFTGNNYEKYVCPKNRGFSTSLEIGKTAKTQIAGIKSNISNEYWIATNGGTKRFIDAQNNMRLYQSGITHHAILIDDFPHKKHALIIEFTRYREDLVDSGFMQVFKVTTYLSEKFQIQYEVYTSRWLKNVDPVFTTQVDSQFANNFRDVIQAHGNILEHPEIIEQFVINNERVVQYVKDHSNEINK